MSDEFDEVDPEWYEWAGSFLGTNARHPWLIYCEGNPTTVTSR